MTNFDKHFMDADGPGEAFTLALHRAYLFAVPAIGVVGGNLHVVDRSDEYRDQAGWAVIAWYMRKLQSLGEMEILRAWSRLSPEERDVLLDYAKQLGAR